MKSVSPRIHSDELNVLTDDLFKAVRPRESSLLISSRAISETKSLRWAAFSLQTNVFEIAYWMSGPMVSGRNMH